MRYQLRHTTHYDYSGSVTLSHNEARLLPRELPWQHCSNSELTISPTAVRQRERIDFFGNRVVYFSIQEVHDSLDVTVSSSLTTLPRPLPDPNVIISWEQALRELAIGEHRVSSTQTLEHLHARLFALDSPFVQQSLDLVGYSRRFFTRNRSLVEAVLELNQTIFNEFTYDPEFTTLATPLQTVLESRRGVCQDFAHLAIGCLRSLGLAARYISGYMETLPPPGQEKLLGADASHAWLSVYIPGWGWLDIDPTNGTVPDERYITLGWGRDFADVTPLKGVMNGGGEHQLQVAVDVIPVPPELKSSSA